MQYLPWETTIVTYGNIRAFPSKMARPFAVLAETALTLTAKKIKKKCRNHEKKKYVHQRAKNCIIQMLESQRAGKIVHSKKPTYYNIFCFHVSF